MADSPTATRLHPSNLDISRAFMWWHETELNLVGSPNGVTFGISCKASVYFAPRPRLLICTGLIPRIRLESTPLPSCTT
jgi:hypothetical protein